MLKGSYLPVCVLHHSSINLYSLVEVDRAENFRATGGPQNFATVFGSGRAISEINRAGHGLANSRFGPDFGLVKINEILLRHLFRS